MVPWRNIFGKKGSKRQRPRRKRSPSRPGREMAPTTVENDLRIEFDKLLMDFRSMLDRCFKMLDDFLMIFNMM